MPLTRLQFETLLVGPDMLSGRCGRRMNLVRMHDPATATLGAIPALADPIAESLRAMGTPPLDPTNPTDFDLSMVPDSRFDMILSVAELRCLESVLGNWDQCDQKVMQGEQALGKLADGVQKSIDALRKRLADQYGYGRNRGVPVVVQNIDRPRCSPCAPPFGRAPLCR